MNNETPTTPGNPPAIKEDDPLRGHVAEVIAIIKAFSDIRTEELILRCQLDHLENQEASIGIEIKTLGDRELHFSHLEQLGKVLSEIQDVKRLDLEIENKTEILLGAESKVVLTIRPMLPADTNIYAPIKSIDVRDLI